MQKRVLVVDDSMVSRMLVKEIISTVMPGADIVEAGSGSDALEKLKACDFVDIALIDFNMPGMTGLELMVEMEKVIRVPRRALLTANIQDEIRQSAEALGVSFLNKPITEGLVSDFLLGQAQEV